MENIKATQITAGMTISYAGDTATVLEVYADNSGFGFDLVMNNGESWFIFKGMEVELIANTLTTVTANSLECSCGQRHALMAGQEIAACKCGDHYKIPVLGYNESAHVVPLSELELRRHNQAIWVALGKVTTLTKYNDAMISKLSA